MVYDNVDDDDEDKEEKMRRIMLTADKFTPHSFDATVAMLSCLAFVRRTRGKHMIACHFVGRAMQFSSLLRSAKHRPWKLPTIHTCINIALLSSKLSFQKEEASLQGPFLGSGRIQIDRYVVHHGVAVLIPLCEGVWLRQEDVLLAVATGLGGPSPDSGGRAPTARAPAAKSGASAAMSATMLRQSCSLRRRAAVAL